MSTLYHILPFQASQTYAKPWCHFPQYSDLYGPGQLADRVPHSKRLQKPHVMETLSKSNPGRDQRGRQRQGLKTKATLCRSPHMFNVSQQYKAALILTKSLMFRREYLSIRVSKWMNKFICMCIYQSISGFSAEQTYKQSFSLGPVGSYSCNPILQWKELPTIYLISVIRDSEDLSLGWHACKVSASAQSVSLTVTESCPEWPYIVPFDSYKSRDQLFS